MKKLIKLILFLTLANVAHSLTGAGSKVDKLLDTGKIGGKDDSSPSREETVVNREETMKQLRDDQKNITQQMRRAAADQIVKAVTGQQTGFKKMSGYEKFVSPADLSSFKIQKLILKTQAGDKQAEKDLVDEVEKTIEQKEEEKQANKEQKADAAAALQAQLEGEAAGSDNAELTITVDGQEVSLEEARSNYALYRGLSDREKREQYPHKTSSNLIKAMEE